jgi:anaerobic ribonucleoside-triphosphate reductase activating protein
MRITQIRKTDVANGTGIRVTIFVAGCTHRCAGCFNREYFSFEAGELVTEEMMDQIISLSQKDYIEGLSVLGGEPLQQVFDKTLVTLLKRFKQEVGKSVWLYTGYTYEEAIQRQERLDILSYCDVLVDGKFEIAQKDLRLKFRGSRNQRIIDVQRSLNEQGVILYDE